LNDDTFKKLKSILSGSLQLSSSKPNQKGVERHESNEELINSFMDQILDSSWIEEDLKAMCAPSYHLSTKNKTYWLMNTTVKSMFNVKGGIEIIPIENGKTNTVCLIGQSMYSIPNDLIVCSGWN
tara:strand:+ start:229 stop:603 length:375 start_codon:yes stop_codon:yes gene_type:complete